MNKKEAILKSALKLLTEKGIHNTPMSAIAKEAGTGMGTIYNYFSNKDILINEIYVGIKEQEKGLFKTFEDEKPIKTQFENYFVSLIDFFLNNPLYFQFMEQLQASPIITEESRTKGLEAVEAVVQLIQIGQQERIIKSIDSGELLQFIGGAMLAYLRWVFNQPAPHRQSLQNQLTMVWDAIKE
ncbi:AcrR family transcriptional regulator [Dyadobacter jejuensis]|uniref:AcrR family transcriptional regulator n=1 Tax=Dyadobacter jejuensis TaxID=1082580 RepID=A0A316AQF0_9BACT|nr:TetR/AcrR family transcriptional regulator [Dyadobacter jejuensis]PWJ59691.1 AcrR family transcriptional regulator [Dyadobacter jejuensis]